MSNMRAKEKESLQLIVIVGLMVVVGGYLGGELLTKM